MATKLAFVTYETPFAPSGGIAAVMGRLPAFLQDASPYETVVISPYHHRIAKTTSLDTQPAGDVSIVYGNEQRTIQLLRHDDGPQWYFLQPDDQRFFAGAPHPYLVGGTPSEIAGNLLRDALVFGTATVEALKRIDGRANWVLFLQDWEAATAALAASHHHRSWRMFATLHNSYDCGVTDADLRAHGIATVGCPGTTVLSRALPLLEKTIFTVSDQFAYEFTEDDFQSKVMADHLQGFLRARLLGVNNGPFVELSVPTDIMEAALSGDHAPLAEWKQTNRESALAALDNVTPSDETPVWGDLTKFDRGDASWFVMAGRDDTRQKGYDVAAEGIRQFLYSGGDARFFFFPIPGDEGLDGLSFLRRLANDFPERVLVFPFIWREGFMATLRGSSFGLMPSLYEPFGMANEFYLNGTVGIGRATGGIIQQIVPLRGVACFSHAAETRTARWHSSSASPTGLLFRERDSTSAVNDWRIINATKYHVGGSPDRVEERLRCPLFRAMTNELRLSLADGARLYSENSRRYFDMLVAGIVHVQRSFSWQRATHEYLRTIGE